MDKYRTIGHNDKEGSRREGRGLKGDQRILILWTIVLGAVGAVLGAWLAGLIGVAVTISLGLIRWIFSVVAAMILINIYITATRR